MYACTWAMCLSNAQERHEESLKREEKTFWDVVICQDIYLAVFVSVICKYRTRLNTLGRTTSILREMNVRNGREIPWQRTWTSSTARANCKVFRSHSTRKAVLASSAAVARVNQVKHLVPLEICQYVCALGSQLSTHLWYIVHLREFGF